jgi:hypothetical protein
VPLGATSFQTGAIFFLLSFAAFMKSDVANTGVQNL